MEVTFLGIIKSNCSCISAYCIKKNDTSRMWRIENQYKHKEEFRKFLTPWLPESSLLFMLIDNSNSYLP